MNDAIAFLEWVNDMFPPEYSMDIRRRFTPQVKTNENDELLWIETHTRGYQIFYTTKEVYDMWLETKK